MKKRRIIACVILLVCCVAFLTTVAVEETEINLDLESLYQFAVHTTTDGTQFTTVTENTWSDVILFAASYKDGRLAETKRLDFMGGVYTFEKPYDAVKVFAFESAETLKPIAEAEEVVIG